MFQRRATFSMFVSQHLQRLFTKCCNNGIDSSSQSQRTRGNAMNQSELTENKCSRSAKRVGKQQFLTPKSKAFHSYYLDAMAE